MLFDLRQDEYAPIGLKPLQRAGLVLLHQTAVTDYIGCQYRGEAPVHCPSTKGGSMGNTRPARHLGTSAQNGVL